MNKESDKSCSIKSKKCCLFFRLINKIPLVKCLSKKILACDSNNISSADDNIGQINKMQENIESFYSKVVEDIAIPRSSICSINKDAGMQEIFSLMNTSGHTRVLVHEGDIDNIVGFVHMKDLFMLVNQKKEFIIKNCIRSHIITTSSSKLVDLLTIMRKNQVHIAVVVDEYGGTDGMVTIEDIIEELIGPIKDEHDKEERDYIVQNDGSIIVKSTCKIEDVENLLKIKIRDSSEEDSYDTIGGFVMAFTGHLPKIGEKIKFDNKIQIQVIEATQRKIVELKITVV